jgi:hypothetical protein
MGRAAIRTAADAGRRRPQIACLAKLQCGSIVIGEGRHSNPVAGGRVVDGCTVDYSQTPLRTFWTCQRIGTLGSMRQWRGKTRPVYGSMLRAKLPKYRQIAVAFAVTTPDADGNQALKRRGRQLRSLESKRERQVPSTG